MSLFPTGDKIPSDCPNKTQLYSLTRGRVRDRHSYVPVSIPYVPGKYNTIFCQLQDRGIPNAEYCTKPNIKTERGGEVGTNTQI